MLNYDDALLNVDTTYNNTLFHEDRQVLEYINMKSPDIKYFVYQNQHYPLDFTLLKSYSNYFFRNQKLYQDITLLNFDIIFTYIPNFSCDTIKTFILYCQNKPIQFDNSKIIPLYLLSDSFEILTLKNEIELYIEDHHKELIDDFFSNFHKLKQFDQRAYENILYKHLHYYSKDDRLFLLSISSLHRIISQYYAQAKSVEKDEESIVEFIFKYIEQYGYESTILLDNISFEKISLQFLHQMFTKYPSLYNYDIIHKKIVRSTFEINLHLSQRENEMRNDISFLKNEIQSMKNQLLYLSNKDQIDWRVYGLISYLNKENIPYQNNDIFIQDKTDTIDQIINKKGEPLNKIGIRSNIIEKLYLIGKLNSDEFINQVLKFNDFTFEMNNSNEYFISILHLICEIKQNYLKAKWNIYLIIEKENLSEIKNYKKYINGIYLKSNVSKIENESFCDFVHLNKITFPPTFKSIGINSFMNTALIEITIPNSVRKIKNGAFMNCESLIKVDLPLSLEKIGNCAFKGCIQLKKIVIQSPLKLIQESTFENCKSLARVILPNSVVTIENQAFCECESLNLINIPESLQSIKSNVFKGCKSLTQISFPDSMKSIGPGAFSQCISLKKIEIPSSVFYIGNDAFLDCHSLNELKIPEMVSCNLPKKIKVKRRMVDANKIYEYATMFLNGDVVDFNLLTAVDYYELSAIKGNTDALIQLGDIYYSDFKDFKKGKKYYLKAIKKGNSLANLKLANAIFEFEEEKSDGVKYYFKAFEDAIDEAIVKLGNLYFDGLYINEDKDASAGHYRLAIGRGNIEAMMNYGEKINKEKSIEIIRNAAMEKNIKAMNHYAHILYNGDFVSANKEKAIEFYKMAADQGDFNSIFNYALILMNGDGIPVDKQEAIKYFKKIFYSSEDIIDKYFLSNTNDKLVQEQNNSSSILDLTSVNSLNDKEKAIIHYQKEAFKGNPNAMNCLAQLLFNGNGIPENKEEAIKYFKIAIKKGNSDAMVNYANILLKGDAVPYNKEEAIKYLKDAIEKGNSESMNNYGKLLENEGDEKNACIYYKMAIKKNNSNAMLNYALLLYNDIEKNNFKHDMKNKKLSITLIQMAIALNNDKAMYIYATLLYNGKFCTADKEEAFKFFKMAADRGNNEALLKVIKMLDTGDYITVNKDAIFKYFKIEAEKGKADFIFNYIIKLHDEEKGAITREELLEYYKLIALEGDSNLLNSFALKLQFGGINLIPLEDQKKMRNILYYNEFIKNSNSCSVDPKEVLYYFKLAADKGNVDSMLHCANILIKGNGVEADKKEGIHYLKMAIDKGNIEAMLIYAFMLTYGDGVNADIKEAIKYYKMASNRGSTRAMCNYARIVYNGDGVEANKEEAKRFYQMAANNGDAFASYLLANLNF